MAAPRRKGRRERHACGRDTPVFQTSLDKTFVHFWTTLSVNSGQKIPSLTKELFPLPGDQAGDQDDGDELPRQRVHLQRLRQAHQSRGSPEAQTGFSPSFAATTALLTVLGLTRRNLQAFYRMVGQIEISQGASRDASTGPQRSQRPSAPAS